MTTVTHAKLAISFNDALTAWSAKQEPRWKKEHLFRVDPGNGYPQAGTHLTAFATALFAEFVALTGPEAPVARVAYRGIPETEQTKLHALFTTRHPAATLESREKLALDFSLVHRNDPSHPHSVGTAMESEMKPISSSGSDPEELVPDFTKLCLLRTGPKLFICRMNGGRETINGRKLPKSERILTAIRNTILFASVLPGTSNEAIIAAFVVETGPKLPGRVHTLLLDAPTTGNRPVSTATFEVT